MEVVSDDCWDEVQAKEENEESKETQQERREAKVVIEIEEKEGCSIPSQVKACPMSMADEHAMK